MNKRSIFARGIVAAVVFAAPVLASAQTNLSPVWKISSVSSPPASLTKTWFPTTAANTVRGMCASADGSKLYVVTRTPANAVTVIDALTGADNAPLSFNITGVAGGGGAVVNKIGVAGDGAIYMCNLDTSNNLKVYRWANEATALDATAAGNPTVAYLQSSLDPADAIREGDDMAVTGSGVNTKILLSGTGLTLTVLTTVDGVNFTRTGVITPATPALGATADNIAWDPNGVDYWARSVGNTQTTRYNGTTNVGITSYSDGETGRGPIGIATDPTNPSEYWHVLVPGNSAATGNVPAKVRNTASSPFSTTITYNLNNIATGDATSGSATANTNGSGDVVIDTATNRVWTLYSNNSIAYFTDGGLVPVELSTFLVE